MPPLCALGAPRALEVPSRARLPGPMATPLGIALAALLALGAAACDGPSSSDATTSPVGAGDTTVESTVDATVLTADAPRRSSAPDPRSLSEERTTTTAPADARPTRDPAIPGFPYALAHHPDDATLVYFTLRQGMMASDDGGATWQLVRASKAPPGTEVHHVSVTPDGAIWLGGPGTLRRSTDGGETFEDVPELGAADIRGLVATDDGRIAVLVPDRGVLETEDDGGSWMPVGPAPSGAYGLYRVPGAPGRLISIDRDDDRLLISDDDGASWTPLQPEGLGTGAGQLAAGPDGLRLAATTEGLFRSDDGGEVWIGVGPFPVVVAVAVAPDDPDTILTVIPGGSVYRSPDGGRTWPGTDGSPVE